MSTDVNAGEGNSPKRLFVPSIAVSALALALSNTIITLLLLEIASTFQVQEGIAAQLKTVNYSAEIVFAMLMGFFAIRLKHKHLLLIGTLLLLVSAVGTFFAPTLEVLLIFSFIEGSGTVIVTIISLTLIGDTLPLAKKNKAVLWVMIAGFISILAGTPIINLIAGIGGWRYAFLLLVLPISVAGFFLAFIGISSSKPNPKQASEKGTYLRHFKQIFKNKSALSYLISNLFFTGAGNAVFIIAFFRLQFSLPREYVVPIILGSSSLYIVSSLVISRYINRFGAKLLTVAGAFGSGILLLFMFSSTDVWIALAINFIQAFLTGMTISAYPCLALDQVPKSRSTMMSLTRIFATTGNTLVPAIGGTLLVLLSTAPIGISYQAVGIAFGIMNITAASVLYFFTKDPNKP